MLIFHRSVSCLVFLKANRGSDPKKALYLKNIHEGSLLFNCFLIIFNVENIKV